MAQTLGAPALDRGFLALFTKALLLLTLTVCVVVPHSFQTPTAALLVVAGLFATFAIRLTPWFSRLLLLYCAGTFVSVVYLFIGYTHGAPNDAMITTALVYIASPLLWLIIGQALMQLFAAEGTVRLLLWLTWAALLSIVLFFYAYFAFGRDAVKFLTEDANINVRGGFAGATMLVYGSMIFLAGAFFAEPAVVRWRPARFVMPAALIAAAATSGRSAFLIAIPIGFVVGSLLRAGLHPRFAKTAQTGIPLLPTVGTLVALIAGVVLLNSVFAQLDLAFIFNLFTEKLLSGGGSERVEQAYYLWQGVEETMGLGKGHGVGVLYLRSDEFPWRYELLPLASLLRVGILGTIVYTLPFLFAAGLVMRRFSERSLRPADIYMTGGLAAACVATFTNPYLESFIFQWMYFIPVVVVGSFAAVPSSAAPPALKQVGRTATAS